jgi:hypothetical protein
MHFVLGGLLQLIWVHDHGGTHGTGVYQDDIVQGSRQLAEAIRNRYACGKVQQMDGAQGGLACLIPLRTIS